MSGGNSYGSGSNLFALRLSEQTTSPFLSWRRKRLRSSLFCTFIKFTVKICYVLRLRDLTIVSCA